MCGRARSNIRPVDIRRILDNVLNANTMEPSASNHSNHTSPEDHFYNSAIMGENWEERIVNSADDLSPGMMMYVAFMDDKQMIHIKPMLWGITMNKLNLFNTQVEVLDQKPMYWKLATKNRGVVFVDGYYEWKSNGRGKPKTKYLVSPTQSDYFILPVLFNNTGKFAVLTQDPVCNEVALIHHRQPVILSHQQTETWIRIQNDAKTAWSNLLLSRLPTDKDGQIDATAAEHGIQCCILS